MAADHAPESSSAHTPDPGTQFTQAQAELASLVQRAAELRSALAMLEAQRLVAIHEAMVFAVRRADAFVSAHVSPTGRRELARRAVGAELALVWRLSEYTLQRLISESYTICTLLPATLAAMREGVIDAAQARVIAHAVAPLGAEGEVIALADAELAGLARTMAPAKLRHAARRVLERLQLDSVGQRHQRARDARGVQVEAAPDGMAWLSVQMSASDALLIKDRLRRAALAACNDGCESRSPAQVEADLARDLLLHAVPTADGAAAVSSIRPTVHVTVPVLTLLGLDDAPGDLDGYGPIDAEAARRLAAAAPSFTRLLTHPISGAVLDVDRASYRVPADLRRWLQVRDGTCRFPGCTRPALRCEVDHSKDWAAEHGATAHDNLAHLCASHHHLKHETAWSLRHLDGGVLEWTSLTGQAYRTTPVGGLLTSTAPLQSSAASHDSNISCDRRESARRYPAAAPF